MPGHAIAIIIVNESSNTRNNEQNGKRNETKQERKQSKIFGKLYEIDNEYSNIAQGTRHSKSVRNEAETATTAANIVNRRLRRRRRCCLHTNNECNRESKNK